MIGRKITIISIGIILLVTPFVIAQVMTPQQNVEHAAQPATFSSSIPDASAIRPGCFYKQVCPSCPAGKACVCESQLICPNPTLVPSVGNK